MRAKTLGVAGFVVVLVLLTACNPEWKTYTYRAENTGSSAPLVGYSIQYRYDGNSPALIRTLHGGVEVRSGWATAGQTFGADGYISGGCISLILPPAETISVDLEVRAEDGRGNLIGNLTPAPGRDCSLADMTCKLDPTPLFHF